MSGSTAEQAAEARKAYAEALTKFKEAYATEWAQVYGDVREARGLPRTADSAGRGTKVERLQRRIEKLQAQLEQAQAESA